MPDFAQVLVRLRPDDLKLLLPCTPTDASESPSVNGKSDLNKKRKTPGASKGRRHKTGTTSTLESQSPAPPSASPVPSSTLTELGAQPHPLPVFKPESTTSEKEVKHPLKVGAKKVTPVNIPATVPTTSATMTGNDPQRKPSEHVWPPVGALLTATYFGTVYRAEIVAARKKLKSGKQIRLLDGPAKGKRLDSLSAAMLVATAKQRKQFKLARKGVSSGWTFWQIVQSPPTNS